MGNEKNNPLRWREFRDAEGALDHKNIFIEQLFEDLVERQGPSAVETPTGRVITETTLFDYERGETREIILLRSVQTTVMVGLLYPVKTTRYSLATWEKGRLVDVAPVRALKGQAVSWWLRKGFSPIAKLRERGWI